MELGEILNVVLGGGLVGAVVSIMTIRSSLRKVRAEAERALAESETVKLSNTEQATRILMQNIVDPLKIELNETRKELCSLKRELARFRKAVDSANSCRYSDDCPVLERMRDPSRDRSGGDYRASDGHVASGQPGPPLVGQRGGGGGDPYGAVDGSEVGGDAGDSDRQPP